jgi:predicted permease
MYFPKKILHKILIISLLVALIISFLIFFNTVVLNGKDHRDIYNTWQFPMILAVFLDTAYNNWSFVNHFK